MKIIKSLSSTLGLLTIIVAQNSWAADDITVTRASSSSGLYIGASAGNASYDTADDSDISFNLFGGFNLNQNVAIEAGWTNLGEVGPSKAETTAIHAGVVGQAEIARDISAFGKIGLTSWDTDYTGGSDSGSDIFFGLGADYHLSNRAALRFGLDFYTLSGDGSIADEDVMNFYIGAKFNM